MNQKLFLKILLCKGDEKIAWGNLLITNEECCTCFGELYDSNFRINESVKEQLVQLYAGLIVEHVVDEQGAKILLKLYELVRTEGQEIEVKQVLRFKSTSRIPLDYVSEEYDSINLLDDYVLIFQARWC